MGESKKPIEELLLEEMAGQIVSKDLNLEIAAENKNDGKDKEDSLDKKENQEEDFLKLQEMAKQIAAQERVKIGTKVVFDLRIAYAEENAGTQGTIFGFEPGDSNGVLLSEDDIKAEKFSILIELSTSKSGSLYALKFEFDDFKQKIKNGEIKILN